MNTQTNVLSGLAATVTAHRDPARSLLMFSLTADEVEATEDAPARVAFVIDRSGSMSGDKLISTRLAVAKMLRSLRPADLAAVVAYDDRVDVLCRPQRADERLAARVAALEPGGSTNLYGGWLEGARLIGEGGRVVLLSDGQANVGRYTQAHDLGRHAHRSYERYGVTTSTIGVGADYDEALMAGMARHGGGAHYFASDVQGILDAFSQERFSIGAQAVSHVSLEIDGRTIPVGHLWSGEVRHVVVRGAMPALAVLHYTVRATGQVYAQTLVLPTEFGHSDGASLTELLDRIADAQDRAGAVHDPVAAGEVREALRSLLLELRNHALADDDRAVAIGDQVVRAMANLEALEHRFDEQDARVFRKVSHQRSHNLRQPMNAYAACQEDAVDVMSAKRSASTRATGGTAVAHEAFQLAPLEQWMAWGVVPTEVREHRVIVWGPSANDGLLFEEIARHTGRRVEPRYEPITAAEVAARLAECRAEVNGA